MELMANLLSTGVCFMTRSTVDDFKAFLPDVAALIANKYKFVEHPRTAEEFSSNEGLKFRFGHYDSIVLTNLTLFSDAISCQSVASTDQIVGFGEDLVKTLAEAYGSQLASTTSRWLFNSVVEIKLRSGFDRIFPPLTPAIQAVRQMISDRGVEIGNYGTAGITLGGEGDGGIKPGRFVLERRLSRPWSENVFFSEAPTSSDQHLELLEKIEALF